MRWEIEAGIESESLREKVREGENEIAADTQTDVPKDSVGAREIELDR